MSLLKFSALSLLLSSQISAVVASPGSGDAKGTSASSSTHSTNTPCNGYPSFCNRKYSNVTMVAAHNSPFIAPGNVASNQYLNVTTQLNDGIRMCTYHVGILPMTTAERSCCSNLRIIPHQQYYLLVSHQLCTPQRWHFRSIP
jgi:hypothetical protein